MIVTVPVAVPESIARLRMMPHSCRAGTLRPYSVADTRRSSEVEDQDAVHLCQSRSACHGGLQQCHTSCALLERTFLKRHLTDLEHSSVLVRLMRANDTLVEQPTLSSRSPDLDDHSSSLCQHDHALKFHALNSSSLDHATHQRVHER
jgi:hypothetical protein